MDPVDGGAPAVCPFGFGRKAGENGIVAAEVIPEPGKASGRTAPSMECLLASPGEAVDGFLSAGFGLCSPRPIPPLPLDGPHAIWEEMGQKLAEMNRSGDYTPMETMPVLDASAFVLPDIFLKRAAMLLGAMAHSYGHLGPGKGRGMFPMSVKYPWELVNKRMGRPSATMSYQDYFSLNLCWKPSSGDPEREFTDDSIYTETEVSVKAFGHDNELFFIRYNVGMDWFSRSMPLDMAKAQQAVLDGDSEALAHSLYRIADHITALGNAFTAINPHPLAPNFCCPVVWSKTIGKIIPPAYEGEFSLSGLQNSSIHLVDIFLGRTKYMTDLGKLALDERVWLPSLHARFFTALAQVSVRDFVVTRGCRKLRRLYSRLVEMWTGSSEMSWMNLHRLKMADFLELGMKTSREKSSGNTASGDWGETRAWEKVDQLCIEAMQERFAELDIKNSGYTPAMVLDVEDVSGDSTRVVFDVGNTGLVFAPGDRVRVMPRNSPLKVLMSMRELGVPGSHEVRLSEPWLRLVEQIGISDALFHRTLPLHDFLLYAQIRPLSSSAALGIMQAMKVHNTSLRSLILSGSTVDDFEFWDFLVLCKALSPGATTDAVISELGAILPPVTDRQYSITSASTSSNLEIVVGQLWYDADESECEEESKEEEKVLSSVSRRWQKLQTFGTAVSRNKFKQLLNVSELRQQSSPNFIERSILAQEKKYGRSGVCSTYLRLYSLGTKVLIRIESASHFHIPHNPNTPVVMFGLGTGIAPFRSFVHALAGKSELWMFWGLRRTEDLFFWKEWAEFIQKGQLNLRIAFSRDMKPLAPEEWPDSPTEAEAHSRWSTLTGGMERTGRLGELLSEPQLQSTLAKLIDQGAICYACGQPELCVTMRTAVVSALEHSGESKDAAQLKYYELIGEGRIREDLFTSYATAAGRKKQPIPRSQVARHCEEDSCWVVFDGHVYDLTKFLMEHPGGPKILLDKAGRDCTADFDRAHGLGNSRVRGMFAPYHLGPVAPLPKEGRELFESMIKVIDKVCEAANVFRTDWNRFPGLPKCLPAEQTSFYRDLEVHRRFTTTTLPLLMRAFREIWDEFDAGITAGKYTASSKFQRVVVAERAATFNVLAKDAFAGTQSQVEDMAAKKMPEDEEQLAAAIEADRVWLAEMREVMIDLLEELEASWIAPNWVSSRMLALLVRGGPEGCQGSLQWPPGGSDILSVATSTETEAEFEKSQKRRAT